MYLLIAILFVYAGMVAFLYFFQSRFMYSPERRLIATPHEIGGNYEAITFRTEDGVELSAWFVPAKKSRGVVLFCHGNAGNISNRISYLEVFQKLGLSTLMFDYRGYGASEGSPSEKGTYRDALAAWNYLVEKRGVAPERIVLFGESMGGAVASWLAQTNRPAALVIQSAFTSVPDMAAKLYPFIPTRWIVRYSYDTKDYLKKVACPILVVHSCEDEVVPYSQGCKLFEIAGGPKAFIELKGDHNSGFMTSGDCYIDGLKRFIDDYLQ